MTKRYWFWRTAGAAVLAMGAVAQAGAVYAVPFTPPEGNTSPRESTGGASRSNFFIPPNGDGPGNTAGGAARGSFFTPPPEHTSPNEGAGGASRGNFFVPPGENSTPERGAFGSGASRGTLEAVGDDSASVTGDADRSNIYGVTHANAAAASMLAVMPESFYGTTLEAQPTILVYVPPSHAETAVFSLKREDKALVYQMEVALPEGGGVIAVEMPADAPELAVNQYYQWYLALQVENELTPSSPFVDGWVQRISPNDELVLALSQGDTLSKIEALGANGVWYDTASRLAGLVENPADEQMAEHWHDLLEAVGLSGISAEPIVM